jgi:hypothetical protein
VVLTLVIAVGHLAAVDGRFVNHGGHVVSLLVGYNREKTEALVLSTRT